MNDTDVLDCGQSVVCTTLRHLRERNVELLAERNEWISKANQLQAEIDTYKRGLLDLLNILHQTK